MFLLVSLSKLKIFHLCCSRVVRVAIVSHLCRSCSTRVARVSLVLHPCCTRVTFVLFVSDSCHSCVALVLQIRRDQAEPLFLKLKMKKEPNHFHPL